MKELADTPAELVSEIAFVLLLCNADKKHVPFDVIARQAASAYPDDFSAIQDGRIVPQLAKIREALSEAKLQEWGYATGDWHFGWRLTKKGGIFAKRVEKLALRRIYGTDNPRLEHAA